MLPLDRGYYIPKGKRDHDDIICDMDDRTFQVVLPGRSSFSPASVLCVCPRVCGRRGHAQLEVAVLQDDASVLALVPAVP